MTHSPEKLPTPPQERYGKSDPACVAAIKEVYAELDLKVLILYHTHHASINVYVATQQLRVGDWGTQDAFEEYEKESHRQLTTAISRQQDPQFRVRAALCVVS